jgi:hypothetical protein
LELSGTERHARGLGPSKNDYLHIRKRWAQITNDALCKAGLDVRIDHRSYKKQGLNREPSAPIPQKLYYTEKKSGLNTAAGDDIRARHRERVEARSKGEAELTRVVERQKKECRERATELAMKETNPPKVAHSSLSREELNQKRRERYRKNQNMKARTLEKPEAPQPTGKTVTTEPASKAQAALTPSQRAALDDAAAIRSWQEYRERQQQHEQSPSASRDNSKDVEVAGVDRDTRTDADGGNTGRRRDKDYSM